MEIFLEIQWLKRIEAGNSPGYEHQILKKKLQRFCNALSLAAIFFVNVPDTKVKSKRQHTVRTVDKSNNFMLKLLFLNTFASQLKLKLMAVEIAANDSNEGQRLGNYIEK